MARTYTLQATAVVGGVLGSPGAMSASWGNLFRSPNNDSNPGTTRRAGMDGDLVTPYSTPVRSRMWATNIMFDAATLATLRTKKVISVKLTITVSGRVYGNTSTLYPIGYKRTSNSGISASSSSEHWRRASSADSTSDGTAAAGYVRAADSSGGSYSNQSMTIDMSTNLPKYGYVIGPGSLQTDAYITIGGSATLVVVTDEGTELTIQNGTIGSAVSIGLDKSESTHRCTLLYRFGSATGTIVEKTSSTTVSWTPPMSLLNQIPSSESGSCAITCRTYDGDTLVDTKTVTITLSAPSNIVPTINNVELLEAGDVPSSFGLFVQSQSKLRIKTTASGIYGSSIRSVSVIINGETLSGADVTTNYMSAAGTNVLRVTVTDTRGRTATYTQNITISAYSSPSASIQSAQRNSSDDTVVDLVYSWTITSLNNNNAKLARVEYKTQNSNYWTQYGSDFTLTSYSSSGTYQLTGIGGGQSYDIRITVIDSFTTGSKQDIIPISDSWIADYNPTDHTIAIHGEAPGDGFDHWYKKSVKFEHTIYIEGVELTAALINKLKSL